MVPRPQPARRQAFRPVCETLESRQLLNAAAMPAGAEPRAAAAMVMGQSHRDELQGPLLPQLPATPTLSVSTVPANGDQNPYGVAFVPREFPRGGPLNPGDILVSNFNNSSNLQGTGTTITRVTPNSQASVFFQGQPGLGLTTALGVLKRGFVIVGSVPSTDGTPATVQPGSLLILDRNGKQVANLTNSTLLNGPWDLTINDQGERAQVFVANVLSGTVTRLDLRIPRRGDAVRVESITQIASGFAHRADPAAFELGPTGLAFDARRDILYVASTLDNQVFAIPNAARSRSDQRTGSVVFQDNTHLHGPLGLVLAPNGDLITANGDAVNSDSAQPSEIVEFTPKGQFVAQFSLNPNSDAPFGVALASSRRQISLAAVNDDTNMLEVFNTQFN